MRRRVKFTLSFAVLLILTVPDSVDSTKTDYEESLKKADLGETLKLVEPRSLLKNNYNTLVRAYDGKIGRNLTCAQAVVELWDAVLRQEIWALKSK